ncbi:MAG: cobyrinate a,c-diamide synthase [Nitrospirota bacterium]
MNKGSIIIAAPWSGSGKTTISIGLMAALGDLGYRVQPFKVGPDFIDPQYHKKITGRTSRNLDCWMMGTAGTRATYAKACAGADICVTEGVMGLFDGIGRGGIQGSTAEIAKVLGIPVILVVDARSLAGSAAAVIKGFEQMDPEVKIAGVILNRVGSARHEAMLKAAIKKHCKAKVVGVVPREEGLDIPSRHLGLTTDLDGILTPKFIRKLRETVKKYIDMDALLNIASKAPDPAPPKRQGSFKARPMEGRSTARIAVAMDEAFCFYYQDNLEILESLGLEVVPFSPLKDGGLPEGIKGIYFGGGYPEMYARGLALNDFVKNDVREAARAALPIYAECGGLMYLTEGITDLEGVFHPMTGLIPAKTNMLQKRKALGYRTVTVTGDTLFPKGESARGHEFHYSEVGPMGKGVKYAYKLNNAMNEETREGYTAGNILASYVHLHFLSNVKFPQYFAKKVRNVKTPFKRG